MPSAGSNLPRQPHLPPELIYCIIEICNKESLPNCSLVSRTWLSITAPFLYSNCSVYLGGKDQDLSDFLSFLQEGTRLARHVKSFEAKDGRLGVCQLIRLFGYFPHLRDLTIDDVALAPALVVDSTPSPGTNPPVRPSSPIPYLRSLTINCAHIIYCGDYWWQLFDLINSFSVIDILVLDNIWSRDYDKPPPGKFTTIAPGRKARVGGLVFLPDLDEGVQEFVGMMAEHLDVTQVHTLEIKRWCERDLFEQVMAMFGSIKHFSSLIKETGIQHYVSLPASRSSLESITFSIEHSYLYAEGETFDNLHEMFSSSLGALSSISQAAGTQLSAVRYELFGDFLIEPGKLNGFQHLERLVENVDWPSLEFILNKDTFRKLRVVEVSLTIPRVFYADRPDEMSIAEYHARKAKERVVLVDIVEDRLSNLRKGCTVNVWTRDA